MQLRIFKYEGLVIANITILGTTVDDANPKGCGTQTLPKVPYLLLNK
jgi:hypothetical protein